MADPFATALGTLFAGPRAVAAIFQSPGQAAVAISVIRSQPDETTSFGQSRIVQSTEMLAIERSAVEDPAAGDVVAIGGEIVDGEAAGGERLELFGDPLLDAHGLTWQCPAVPAP